VQRKGGCLFGPVYREAFAYLLSAGTAHNGEQQGCRGLVIPRRGKGV
jgi:hypothetical protein